MGQNFYPTVEIALNFYPTVDKKLSHAKLLTPLE